MKNLTAIILILGLSLISISCGKKGELETPSKSQTENQNS
jgi:predicted small lipoprotein YifL